MDETLLRFSTPVEDYMRDIRKVKTLEDLRQMEKRYSLILSDAAPVYEAMNEENFGEFIEWLPKAFPKDAEINEDWARKYGAIVLPRLFLELLPYIAGNDLGSGFVMHRLLDEEMARIVDGKFELIEGN